MPKYKKIGHNTYEYLCECGTKCRLETDGEPIKRLVKCFKCQSKVDLSDEKK